MHISQPALFGGQKMSTPATWRRAYIERAKLLTRPPRSPKDIQESIDSGDDSDGTFDTSRPIASHPEIVGAVKPKSLHAYVQHERQAR